MAVAVAYKNNVSEWVIPQVYFTFDGEGETVSRAALLTALENNTLLQEAMELEPQIRQMVEEAQQERCVPGYSANDRFYDYYKPQIVRLVGSEARHRTLRTSEYYDAVYEAIYELLPGDEFDLYPHGIMPDGRFCPTYQEEYGREYP